MLNHASTVVLCSVNGVLIGHVPCPFLVKTAPSFLPVAMHEVRSRDYFVFSSSVCMHMCILTYHVRNNNVTYIVAL